MRGLAAFLLLVVFFAPCYAGNNLIFYQVGERDVGVARTLKAYFEEKGFSVSVYQGETTIEKHVDRVKRINNERQAIFLAAQFVKSDKERVLVGLTPERGGASGAAGRRGEMEDLFLALDQVPLKFAPESRRLADAVASSFQAKPVRLPLFPLLGVDMPAIFMRIEYKEETLNQTLFTLNDGLQKYFRRDKKNEK